MLHRSLGIFLLLCVTLTQVHAFEARGPILGAASNFSQSWQPRALSGAESIGLTEFRDEVLWHNVEQIDGRLVFSSMRESYPSMLRARGAGMVLLVYTGHPNWESGHLPLSPEGQAAFARYTARIVERFPHIHTVEVGNEFNSHVFASVERWPTDLSARAQAYVRLLEATENAVQKVNPDIRIVGGAAHSIPLAWIEAVMEHGGGKHMDAFVIHTYTTEPEHLYRQIMLMRQVPGLETMPIEITEFGTTNAEDTPGYLLRNYCQMALSGVTRAVWYPFSPRGDGLIPLLEASGEPTGVGRAYRLIRDNFEGKEAVSIAPDAFTYGCKFGESVAIVWGAPRNIEILSETVKVFDQEGAPANGQLQLSRTAPLVLVDSTSQVPIEEQFTLAPQSVLADSYDQYFYQDRPDTEVFDRFVEHRGERVEFEFRPGQQTNGVPWTPYLGISQDGSVRMTPEWAMPSSWGADDPFEIVYRYVSPNAQSSRVSVTIAPSEESADGVLISVRLNQKIEHQVAVTSEKTLVFENIALGQSDKLDVVLGPNRNSKGDFSTLRVTIEREDDNV